PPENESIAVSLPSRSALDGSTRQRQFRHRRSLHPLACSREDERLRFAGTRAAIARKTTRERSTGQKDGERKSEACASGGRGSGHRVIGSSDDLKIFSAHSASRRFKLLAGCAGPSQSFLSVQ